MVFPVAVLIAWWAPVPQSWVGILGVGLAAALAVRVVRLHHDMRRLEQRLNSIARLIRDAEHAD